MMIRTGKRLTIADWARNQAFIRVARKQHHCAGLHDHEQRRNRLCGRGPIRKGDAYVEYIGETGAYQSGQRFHLACAVSQGILEEVLPERQRDSLDAAEWDANEPPGHLGAGL